METFATIAIAILLIAVFVLAIMVQRKSDQELNVQAMQAAQRFDAEVIRAIVSIEQDEFGLVSIEFKDDESAFIFANALMIETMGAKEKK